MQCMPRICENQVGGVPAIYETPTKSCSIEDEQRGDPGTSWGSVRAAMGHPEPFQLNYISIGNQECSMHYYKENYRKFYSAIKASYLDIKIISSCDRSTISPIDPVDLYDVHVYTSSGDMSSKSRMFDSTPRGRPKAIVSEYAVTGNDVGQGTLVASLAEAAFLIGLERNRFFYTTSGLVLW
uniref:Uncharacterized protein n=2 Tax=Avena sativa TaxID=4498 RepID=A0ACD5XS56_AVESA